MDIESMEVIFKERISGKRLLRFEASGGARANVCVRRDDGLAEWRELACKAGVSCTPIGADSRDVYEVSVVSSGGIDKVTLVDVPRIRLDQVQSHGSPVVCGLASIPSRVLELANVVESLLPQVDHLIVYLNGFGDVPAFLRQPRITVFRSEEYGDYRDNSKYFGLRCFDEDVYFFSVDDDINYPPDYVSSLIRGIECYGKAAVVGVHGAIYGSGSRLFLDRAVLHFGDQLEFDMPVSALGTGTCAFHTSTLRPESLEFEQVGMADLVVARIASERQIPEIAMARPSEWMTAQSMPETGQNLFSESIELESIHDLYVRAGHVPGPGRVQQLIDAAPEIKDVVNGHAKALLAYLVALEHGQRSELLAMPYREPVHRLAENLRWIGLQHAMARGVVRQYWEERRTFVSTILPFRAASLGAEIDVLEKLIEYIDGVVDGMLPVDAESMDECPDDVLLEAALAAAKGHGHEELVVAISAIRIFSGGGVDSLHRLHAELCRAGLGGMAGEVGELLCRVRGDYASETLLEASAMNLRQGAFDEVWQVADKLMATGFIGQQLLASAGLLTGKAWTEDLILALFVNAKNNRHVKRIAELAKMLRKVQLPDCHPELWADAMSEMSSEVRHLAAGVLLTNRRWSDRIRLDSLELGSQVERVLWKTAIGAATGLLPREANHAVNRVFFAGGLLPVELDAEGGKGFFHQLRAEPLPAWRDPSAPLVSVIMAAYNCQDTIDYALRSVAAQSYPNVEILVIDDCSPSPVVLPQWARDRPDITLHRVPVNVGPYECRNVAIAMSRGEFIATHDADDWMHPQKIQRQVEALSGSSAVASYTRHIRLLSDGTPALENNGMFTGDGPITSMFRRPLFEALGGFMPVRTRGDMEFKARLVTRYRRTRVAHDDAVTLLALDSLNSNSKVYTKSSIDEINVSRFKRWYSVEHSIAHFRRSQALPTGLGRLFDVANPSTGDAELSGTPAPRRTTE